MTIPPPHRSTPTLHYVTAEGFDDFHAAVARGFQEEPPPQARELDRAVLEPDRFFGFRVGQRWVSSCGAASRSLTVPGGAAVPVAAVTAVTVLPPYRRRGLLTQMMRHQLADVHHRGEPLAALWASESSIYGRFGYGHAAPRLRLSGRTRSLQFLPEIELGDGTVDEVSREQFLAAAPAIRDAEIAQRPGALDRPAIWWPMAVYDLEFAREGATALRYVLHYDAAGDADGYASYRIKSDFDVTGPNSEVRVVEIGSFTAAVYARLWRYLLDLDLVRSFRSWAPMDDPLRHIVTDRRTIRTELGDGLYVRIVDLPAALRARRYAADVDVVIEVRDSLLEYNAGRFRLQAGADGVTVRRVRRRPDLTVGITELGAAYLGGSSLAQLHRAGLLAEHRPGTVIAASAALSWHRAPFCADMF